MTFKKLDLLKWTLAGVAVAAGCLVATAQSNPQGAETLTIDENGPSHPFPHFWEQMFGSGRAVLSLREDYRRDLRATKQITELKYVRFHAILDDDIGVYDEDEQGRPVYNFSYVDQIYDGLLQNGVKPFVELSFMPKKLAANPAPHPFWYKPFPSPPNDPQKWSALIEAFTRHLEERYGAAKVQSWYFEVWNEPNIDFWNGEPKQATYFALYDTTADAIKRVDAKLRVGGPATAQAAWVDAFIDHCTRNHVPFDFVSTHLYGNDDPANVLGHPMPIVRSDMVAVAGVKRVHDQVKASAAPNTPIIWSEYNATYMNQQGVTDSAFMGPWLANNIRECDGLAEMMSYWTFSDVFEEQGVIKNPFYGGYGLIAERGIPKAAFRAFELLHRLGETRIESSDEALITKRTDGALVIALWNYAEPDQTTETRHVVLKIEGKHAHAKQYSVQFVDPAHGSALAAWTQMGSPASPTTAQIAQLQRASEMEPEHRIPSDSPIEIPTQRLVLITVR